MEAAFHQLSELAYRLDPKNPDAVSNYSNSFNMKGDYEQRIKYAKDALDLNPSQPRSNTQYGMAICNEGRFSEAEQFLLRAIELDPIQQSSYDGFFPFLYMAMNDSKQAMKWSNILYDRSQHSRYNGFRAAISVHLDKLEDAKIYLRKFKAERPEIKSIEDYAGVAPELIQVKDYLMEGLTNIWDMA